LLAVDPVADRLAHGEAEPFPQRDQLFQDLPLGDHVQGGGGLVQDDDARDPPLMSLPAVRGARLQNRSPGCGRYRTGRNIGETIVCAGSWTALAA
jgi:hypothetical protein